MIKNYNTEAEYSAASKSKIESQVSHIKDGNLLKFDGINVVIGARYTKTGSVAVLDESKALRFIDVDTFVIAGIPSGYTTVGVVAVGVDHPDYKGKLVVVNKANASKIWSYIYSFRLTGYTLDGTDRSGVLSIRESANWGTAVDYTVNYNASSLADFVEQLNTFFQDTTNPVFQTQDWVAQLNAAGDAVDLVFHFTDYRQASNAGKTGFSLSANLLPEIVASANMLRMNGNRGADGTITNWDRAIVYFSQDLNSATYNPTSEVTSPKRQYPICKPGYLGTSAYSGGDQCAALRAIYGAGEEGWRKFMASFLPVRPTQYGILGNKAAYGDGMTNTYKMAGKKFVGQSGAEVVAFPAADYCASVSYENEALKAGAWQLPDMDTVFAILKTIKYGTTDNRNADPVNRALNAIGGSAISNGSNLWSSSRFGASRAWFALGYLGCAYYDYMCNSNLALPVVLLDTAQA